jgi:DNA polymerase III alpha subunit (gram-positive type)
MMLPNVALRLLAPAVLCASIAAAAHGADLAPPAVTPSTRPTPPAVPPYVAALDNAPFATSSPAAAPGDWLLAFVDVETTGLVAGYHEMIDIGVVVTDLDGNARDELFLRIQPERPERLAEGARRVNDFDAARWKANGALSPRAAVDALTRFRGKAGAGKNVLMVAYNCAFDTAFLDHLFRGSGRSWRELFHYFVLDLPSMAWSLGYRDLTNGAVAARLGGEDEPRVAVEHTGLTGAQLNARIYRGLMERRGGAASSSHSARAAE